MATDGGCQANSVLQALYFCEPFRDLVVSQAGDQPAEVPPQLKVSAAKGPVPALKSKHEAPTADSPPSASAPTTNDILNGAAALDLTQPVDPSTTLLSTLGDLFATIARHPNKTGVIAPQAFILQLKRENELFRSSMHQDAHEFLNYLLNTIAEQLEKEKQQATPVGSPAHETAPVKSRDYAGSLHGMRQHTTWIQRLFEGVLTNETRCLTCETVRSRRCPPRQVPHTMRRSLRGTKPSSTCQSTSRRTHH
jgi:ubiquitin carboxyl-terminal hydrolase 9/13